MSALYDDKNALWRALGGVDTPRTTNSLADLVAPPSGGSFGSLSPSLLGSILGTTQTKRRRVFFSFHYADVMRVNNFRRIREIGFRLRP